MTPAQKKALCELLPLYELPFTESRIDISALFPQSSRFVVEIGFGDGEELTRLALQNELNAYLGIEVFRPGVGKCLLKLHKNKIQNVRISTSDARDVLSYQLPSNSVNEFIILFPDPWPKSRHRKRRLIDSQFVERCIDRLAYGGTITMVTDCEDYAEQAQQVLTEFKTLKNLSPSDGALRASTIEPQTRYARKAVQSGNPAFELRYARSAR